MSIFGLVFPVEFFPYGSSISVDLRFPVLFVHVRYMVVQVVRPCFLMGLLVFLGPGCGLVVFLCPGCGLE